MSSRYTILEQLGGGAMGIVHRAVDNHLGREVALKIIQPGIAAKRQAVLRFRREAEACAALSHPNIVRILDSGQMEDGQLYISMELIEAVTLDEWSRARQRLDEPVVASLLRQAADALACAHAKGIVHRDLKPQNLMVDSHHHLTLMDFGLVRMEDHTVLTSEGASIGTPRYMAPETIKGEQATSAIDVYGLGVVFWQVLSRQVPFDFSRAQEFVAHIVGRGLPPLADVAPEVSPRMSRLIGRMVDRDARARPAAVEVRDALAGDEPPDVAGQREPAPATPGAHAHRPGSRRLSSRSFSSPGSPASSSRPAVVAVAAVLVLAASLALCKRVPAPTTPVLPSDALGFSIGVERDRIVTLRWRNPGRNEPVSLSVTPLGGPTRTTTATLSAGPVELGGLPPSTPVDLVVTSVRRSEITTRARFTTPRRIVLRNAVCFPSDVGVIVDADNPSRAPLEVTLGRVDDGATLKSTSQPTGRPTLRVSFDGLHPEGRYFVSVSSPGAWGGLHEFGFQCQPASFGAAARDFVRATRGDWMLFDLLGGSFQEYPDTRIIAATERLLSQSIDKLSTDRKRRLLLVLQASRAPVLADLLARSLLSETDAMAAVSCFGALSAGRDPRAPRLGESLAARHPAVAYMFVLAMRAVPGQETFDAIVRYLDRTEFHLWDEVHAALPWIDREATCRFVADELGVRRRRGDAGSLLMALALAGLLADDRAVEALSTFLDRAKLQQYRAAAIQALEATGHPAALARIAREFQQSPDDPASMLAQARHASPATVEQLASRLAGDRPAHVRAAAALALGLAATGPAHEKPPRSLPRPSPPLVNAREGLAAALGSPDPGVRDAAAWALGQQGATCPALRAFALSDRDRRGLGALALARASDVEAAPALYRILRDLTTRTDAAGQYRAAMVALALAQLRHAPARELIRTRVAALRSDSAVSFALREALAQLDHPRAVEGRAFWIDPVSPVHRTGIRLEAGQSVEAIGLGFLGWSPDCRTAFDQFAAAPGRPPLRLCVRIGGRTLRVRSRWNRLVAEEAGEILFQVEHPAEACAPGFAAGGLPVPAYGLARITLRP